MTAKEYLGQLRALRHKIDWAESHYRRLIEMGSAIRYDKPHVKASPEPDGMADRVIKAQKFARKAERYRLELLGLEETIIRQINGLGNRMHTVILLKYYVDGESLAKIADEMHYSYDRIKHMHGEALKIFAGKYGFQKS